MTELDATTLGSLSTEGLSEIATITAGDSTAERLAGDVRRLVSAVNNAAARALGDAARLHGDDMSNPTGVARELAQLPANLIGATAEMLDQAEVNLDVLEGLHLAAILKHDARDDANLREELHHYTVNLEKKNAVRTMVELASDVRYATILSGPMGKSLGARFGFDPSILRSTALQALAVNGTEDQVRRSRALAGIPAARRAVGLARGARDGAITEVQRPPKRQPTTAMFG